MDTKNRVIQKYDLELENSKIKFCRRITALANSRKRKTGKTNEDQSKELGLAKGNLSKYKDSIDDAKTDKIPTPSAKILLRMSEYYGVSIDYLMGKTDFKHPVDADVSGLSEAVKRRIVCDYLNLDEKSIDALRGKTKNTSDKIVMNFLLSNKEVFDAIVDYFTSAFIRVFNASDYAMLGINSVLEKKLADPDEHMKICFANLLDKLPVARRKLSDLVNNDPVLRLTIAHSLARIFINPTAAFAQLCDSGDSKRIEEKLPWIKDLLNEEAPYGEDRFFYERSALDAIANYEAERDAAFDELLRNRQNRDNENGFCENDPSGDPYIHIPIPNDVENEDTAFSSTSFCGIKIWVRDKKQKTDNP